MITQLNQKDEEIAKKMRKVFQESYAIEAELLKAKNFPPLKRTLSSYMEAETAFYGFHEGANLAAVMEVKEENDITHIQSLVVDPVFFRRGIASKLLKFLLENFDSKMFTVETGAANKPAIALYERFDFQITRKWMTDVGIEKVAMKRI
ncbi:GNAT family N-acetyltransferase [Ekhidna sp. MALMAid0563]|uniref:GNAT family N-acetyltransferase n=1 Tax=Ekhidna sp. MALMAid0563 TaxID=3143937 RepID=UPI0032DE7949